jgi:hypothetical protein
MQTKQKKILGFIPAGTQNVEANPSQLLVYSLGDISINTFGNYAVNAVVYGYAKIQFGGDPLSRFCGAIHSEDELRVGREDNPATPTGTFVYDSDAVERLYRDYSICSAIPEEPGSINNETVLGIDANRNMVRDDVEVWILENYTKQIQQKSLMQYAINYQKFWDENPTQEMAFEADKSIAKAVDCLYDYGFPHTEGSVMIKQREDASDELRTRMMNIPDRLRAEGRIMDLLAGHVFVDLDYGKAACDFDVDALEE